MPALAAQPPAAVDSAAFVTRLGRDTLAVERVVRTAGRDGAVTVAAEAVVRAPRTTRQRATLALRPDGSLAAYRLTTGAETGARAGAARAGAAREVAAERAGDSLRVTVRAGGEPPRAVTVAAPPNALPFLEYVHWPFDAALRRAWGDPVVRAALAGGAGVVQPMIGDWATGRTTPFRLARLAAPGGAAPNGADSATVTHPFRGTMRALVGRDGRLLGLDAGATTRKLDVARAAWIPDAALDALADRWAALDAAGRGVAALSGRAEARGAVGPAQVRVDYGTPVARGRRVWGALVPYGELWRTGANEATHFETSAPLVLGAGADTLRVPAGRYTLFSVPAADGGVLVVNRQTGQNGTQYDAARDLGRVRLARRPLAEPAEAFAVRLDAEPGAGAGPAGGALLRLQWADAEYVVPVRAAR